MTDNYNKLRGRIASKFIVLCEDCLHGHNLKDDCPHLDEDICMWQREKADEILSDLGIGVIAEDQNYPVYGYPVDWIAMGFTEEMILEFWSFIKKLGWYKLEEEG